MNSQSSTILVTGAAGFIGAATCIKLLSNNQKVIGIDNINSYYSQSLKLARIENINIFSRNQKRNWKFFKGSIDNRQFINAVFWMLCTGSPWRDLPPDYGHWSNTHRRFIRWRDKGIWEKLLEDLIDNPDYEWLMIDASHCKVHPHAAGAKGGNQDMSRTKGGSTQSYIWPWMRMVCRSGLLLLKVQQQIAHRHVN